MRKMIFKFLESLFSSLEGMSKDTAQAIQFAFGLSFVVAFVWAVFVCSDYPNFFLAFGHTFGQIFWVWFTLFFYAFLVYVVVLAIRAFRIYVKQKSKE